MDIFIQFAPLLKILLAFAAMLAGIRLRLGLGSSILAGAVLTGLLFGLPAARWPEAAAAALTNEKTLFLSAIIGLILILSGILEKTGQSARLMETLTAYLKGPRLRLAFFPALIGLLPMPGGAVFSAPMVEEVSRDMGVSATDKALINYWFRHIWEVAWPLYPGLILSASLGDVPLHSLLACTVPGLPLSIFLGWFFILRRVHPAAGRPRTSIPPHNGKNALRQGLPLLTAIAGAVVLETGIGLFLPGAAFEWGIIMALSAAIGCAAVQNRVPPALLGRILFTRHLAGMLYVIGAIFVFKEFMQAADVVAQLSGLAGGEVALVTAAVLLPFLVGLIAGINVAFVGATFPLMLGLLDQMGMSGQVIPYLMLGQFSGYAGIMLSPLHICLLLTCQHFHVEIGTVWRRLAAPGLLLLICGVGYFQLLTL